MKTKILCFATAIVALMCTAFAVDYKDLAAEGYRWVMVDGPYACTTESEVQRITGYRNDMTELQMVESLEAYYLISGSIVYVLKNDPATGMSEIRLPGITRPLWTYTRFLSTRPIEDVYGVIETPQNSTVITWTGLGPIELPGVEPMPMAKPGPVPRIQGHSEGHEKQNETSNGVRIRIRPARSI